MIATWREVAELAARECPSAGYFAWVSDHDRWHHRWLESLVAALMKIPASVLPYPITRRLTPDGVEIDKGPRLFDTTGTTDLRSRWAHFCRHGVGAGDMVVRPDAARRAPACRHLQTVLRPVPAADRGA
jgi:hypothetical protein